MCIYIDMYIDKYIQNASRVDEARIQKKTEILGRCSMFATQELRSCNLVIYFNGLLALNTLGYTDCQSTAAHGTLAGV